MGTRAGADEKEEGLLRLLFSMEGREEGEWLRAVAVAVAAAAAAAAAAALENNKCSEVRRTLCICVANWKITRHPEGRLVSESAHE